MVLLPCALQILKDAVDCEEDALEGPSLDELGPEAQLLLEELRERQELVVSGQLDLERSFDDFRIAIGDDTL